jgi:putative transposase
MTSKSVAFLVADLGVTKTHNRPYTSTDNPYSEAAFKTLKYRPGFPFASIDQAREFWPQLHRLVQRTPRPHRPDDPQRRASRPAQHVHAACGDVLAAAYAATPERFVRHAPRPPALPAAAWINKPRERSPPLTNFAGHVSHPT